MTEQLVVHKVPAGYKAIMEDYPEVYVVLEKENPKTNTNVATSQWNILTGEMGKTWPLQVWFKWVDPIPYSGDGSDLLEFHTTNYN